MGDDLIALNDGSTVPNRGTKMLGDDSVATNRRPTVQNRGARELGDDSVALNRRPAILGRGTRSVGDESIAVGDGSIAVDSRSTLLDTATKTRWDGSVAVDDGSTLVDNGTRRLFRAGVLDRSDSARHVEHVHDGRGEDGTFEPALEAFPILFCEDTLPRSIRDLDAANAKRGQHGPGGFLRASIVPSLLPGILHEHDKLLFFWDLARLLADDTTAV